MCRAVAGRGGLQQRPVLLQPRRQHGPREFEQLEHARISDAVVDVRAVPPACDETLLAQCGEMLRRAAGVQAECRLQRADGLLALAQELQQSDPGRAAECAEELGLEGANGERV